MHDGRRRGPRRRGDVDRPTRRERQILVALSRGSSYEDVAESLGVTINTVRTHVRSLYAKLGVRTKTAAVIAGIELGLIAWPRR